MESDDKDFIYVVLIGAFVLCFMVGSCTYTVTAQYQATAQEQPR